MIQWKLIQPGLAIDLAQLTFSTMVNGLLNLDTQSIQFLKCEMSVKTLGNPVSEHPANQISKYSFLCPIPCQMHAEENYPGSSLSIRPRSMDCHPLLNKTDLQNLRGTHCSQICLQ